MTAVQTVTNPRVGSSRQGRILFVASQTGRRSDGGLESSARIFERLAADYDWSFVTSHETWFTERWRSGGARVVVTPFDEADPAFTKAGRFAAWTARILALALSQRPDVIHANDPRAWQVAGPVARILRLPLLLTIRDTKPDGQSYGAHWRRAARQCRRVVTLSDEMGERLHREIGVPRAKLLAINSMVDLARYDVPDEADRAAQRSRLRIEPGEFAVGCVGVIRDKKNQLELICRMLPDLVQQVPGARLHFFGDFEPVSEVYSRQCVAAVERLGLQAAVVFHGHQGNMADHYQALDAIVIGSRNEGLARCMIEGMASGVPIVSFAVCSAREMLETTGAGIVVAQGDHASLTQSLAELAGDPDRCRALGRQGRAAAEVRFDPERIARAYRALYDEAATR